MQNFCKFQPLDVSILRDPTTAGLVLRVTGKHEPFHHDKLKVQLEGWQILGLLKKYFEFPLMYYSRLATFVTVAKFTPEAFSFWRSDTVSLAKVCSLN